MGWLSWRMVERLDLDFFWLADLSFRDFRDFFTPPMMARAFRRAGGRLKDVPLDRGRRGSKPH